MFSLVWLDLVRGYSLLVTGYGCVFLGSRSGFRIAPQIDLDWGKLLEILFRCMCCTVFPT